jgi:hypothetical protein
LAKFLVEKFNKYKQATEIALESLNVVILRFCVDKIGVSDSNNK